MHARDQIGKKIVPIPSFGDRLELLYFHCRLTTLQESTRTVQYLKTMTRSGHTDVMIEGMSYLVKQHAQRNIEACEILVQLARSKTQTRLEAE